MIKKEDILVGTIKRCNDYEKYKEYGEYKIEDDFRTGGITFSHKRTFVNTVTDTAFLIRVSDGSFIWLDTLESIADEILVNCGIPIKVINTEPSEDNELYVDPECGFAPYFEESKNERIGVRKLKKEVLLDPRNPRGINH